MNLLISSEEISNYEVVSLTKPIIPKLQIRIKQAQEFDLPKIIPQALIDDMVSNINSEFEEWINLMDFIRPVMVYFSLARFIELHDLNISSFGNETVNTNYSQKLSSEKETTVISRYRSLAHGYASILINFLEDTEKEAPGTYESWKTNTCGEQSISSMAFKIKAIG